MASGLNGLPRINHSLFLPILSVCGKKGVLYLFAESYDYRTRRGDIIAYKLNADLDVIEQRTVLQEPWHLSYPFVFEADNEIWMLPEGYKSGTLTLYRAIEFPWRWEKVPDFSFPCAAIDATPFYAQGKWWMFYTPPLPKAARTDTLMLAHAPILWGHGKTSCKLPRTGIKAARVWAEHHLIMMGKFSYQHKIAAEPTVAHCRC
ncbi:hypothetical protein [Escherichia coli]|uniref:glucosamine inositolphosphorylceramide transferase family protein n=1 Tax=Escherichia coli TaxID=562 RepID=UPI002032F097|nr:hypothetical protein [Escherichia coli]